MVTSVAATTTAAAATDAQAASTKQLAGNFDTFLKLLTTQLQNQDPMSPMDSNQFTQQLVQFSQVEQQINTNDNLKSLIALAQGRSASDAVGYLGKSVTVTSGQGVLSNGQGEWSYALGSAASSDTLTVTDASGKVVYTQAGELGAGQHIFDWDGTDANGQQLPDGVYTLSVAAKAADGTAVDSAVASKGVVDEVNLTGSEPMLMIGSMAVPLSNVAAVNSL
jgi:flagellar basal-body rod modification protein FlgD